MLDYDAEAVLAFLRFVANPSRDFDGAQFDELLSDARRLGYVSVQSKGQIMLTPEGRAQLATEPVND